MISNGGLNKSASLLALEWLELLAVSEGETLLGL